MNYRRSVLNISCQFFIQTFFIPVLMSIWEEHTNVGKYSITSMKVLIKCYNIDHIQNLKIALIETGWPIH